jgi:hypothetical protein
MPPHIAQEFPRLQSCPSPAQTIQAQNICQSKISHTSGFTTSLLRCYFGITFTPPRQYTSESFFRTPPRGSVDRCCSPYARAGSHKVASHRMMTIGEQCLKFRNLDSCECVNSSGIFNNFSSKLCSRILCGFHCTPLRHASPNKMFRVWRWKSAAVESYPWIADRAVLVR